MKNVVKRDQHSRVERSQKRRRRQNGDQYADHHHQQDQGGERFILKVVSPVKGVVGPDHQRPDHEGGQADTGQPFQVSHHLQTFAKGLDQMFNLIFPLF